MSVFGINRLNDLYEHSSHLKGAVFAESLLEDLGVECLIGCSERLYQLPEGAFITVSNHPYGGLDGVMLINLMVEIRPDYKLMVNRWLSLIEALEENFISVRPKVGTKIKESNYGFSGIRNTLKHLEEGHPIGLFPAGAVSMFRFKNLRVRDREWQESVLKLIQVAKVPVIPIRFYDMNSPFFYFLGTVWWRIRLIRMCYELFNKRNHPHRIGIGETISVEEIHRHKDLKSLGIFLQKTIYKMPKPESFVSLTDLKTSGRKELSPQIP